MIIYKLALNVWSCCFRTVLFRNWTVLFRSGTIPSASFVTSRQTCSSVKNQSHCWNHRNFWVLCVLWCNYRALMSNYHHNVYIVCSCKKSAHLWGRPVADSCAPVHNLQLRSLDLITRSREQLPYNIHEKGLLSVHHRQ